MNKYMSSLVNILLLVGLAVLLQLTSAIANTGIDTNNLNNYKSNVSEPKQCFFDAEQAYAYLIAQDKARKQAEKLVGIPSVVDINTASEAQFNTLKGIGSKKAQAIIRYRQQFGAFNSIDELTKVKGIGDKTVENNRSRLTVSFP